ncbi:MAG: phosphatase PAP2 family protein [Armatimonadetes bacterium]|nr:phosphatase PAP2 family protein [Armatimonadota bacterium]
MFRFSRPLLPALIVTLGLLHPHTQARADDDLHDAAKFASNGGIAILLTSGFLLPLVEDGKEGKQNALRVADSALTSAIFTSALKRIVRAPRPDGSSRSSFPSGHATAAFSVATMQAEFHPRQAPYWYAGAALVAASRVKLRRHYWRDVIAGAAIGYFTSKLELRRPHGLLLFPFIEKREETPRQRPTISFSYSF